MPVGTRIDPAQANGTVHPAFFDAENGICQKHRCDPVESGRVGYTEPCLHEQSSQIVVGLVARVVATPVTDEVVDIAEILPDSEEFGLSMAEPWLPMTDDIGVEIELGAASDLARASLDAYATGLPCRHERVVFVRAPCAG